MKGAIEYVHDEDVECVDLEADGVGVVVVVVVVVDSSWSMMCLIGLDSIGGFVVDVRMILL